MMAKRILPRQERDQNAGKAVARREIGVSAPLHGCDFHHAGKTGCRAGKKTNDENKLADAQAHDFGGADIAAGDARRKAEYRVVDQDIGKHRGDEAKYQTPMHFHAGNASDHIGSADFRVDGLLRLVGSRIGPSTRKLRIASAM